MIMKSYFIFAALISGAYSLPVETADKDLYVQGGEIIEDDMIVFPEQKRRLYKPINPRLKNAILNPSRLWPKGVVYYKFDKGICKSFKTIH